MSHGDFAVGQPEILFGFPPGGGGTQRLERLLGSAKALRMILDGGPISPSDAKDLGLVDELVPPEALLDRAIAVAARLGARPKAGVAACKRAVYEGGSLPFAAALRLERSEFLAAAGTSDAEDAMASYQRSLERTGQLPGYDRSTLERALDAGRFSDSGQTYQLTPIVAPWDAHQDTEVVG